MASIVKLTYTNNGKATLVNLDQMTSAFRIFEKTTRKYATRVNLGAEQYVIVDEELQEIQKLSQQMAEGEYQDTDWVQIDSGVENEDFVDRLEQDYQRNTYRPQYQQREYRPRNNYQNNYNNRY
jgi:hypothetical protein